MVIVLMWMMMIWNLDDNSIAYRLLRVRSQMYPVSDLSTLMSHAYRDSPYPLTPLLPPHPPPPHPPRPHPHHALSLSAGLHLRHCVVALLSIPILLAFRLVS